MTKLFWGVIRPETSSLTIFADHCSVEQMFVLRVVGTMAMVGIHAVGSVILKVMW